MPHRMYVNQQVQLGIESTPGTAVAANKLIEAITVDTAIEANTAEYTGTGRKFVNTVEENEEWSSATLGGAMDYNAEIYPLSSVYGKVTPSLVGASSTAYKWVFDAVMNGAANPQTYTVEYGDPGTRAHKFPYGLVTDWGYKFDRKSFTRSGTMLGQAITDGITMTSTPTKIALAPAIAKQINVYLDTTSAGLGGTQLNAVISGEYQYGGVFGSFWPVNRTNPSFGSHIDLKPKATFKLMLEADTVGMSLLANLQAGTTVYVRVQAQGALIDVPNSVNNLIQHDLALKVSKPQKFSDSGGIYAISWDFTVVEDTTWGHSNQITVQNLSATL